jgi:thioesterase domain-containing protein
MNAPEAALERDLHRRIPLSAALGVRVAEASAECERLTAPLAANRNHTGTAFGGSAAAVATLAAWSLLHLRLAAVGLSARTVIQRSRMEYERPIPGDFAAECRLGDAAAWQRFTRVLARRGRARLRLDAELSCAGERVGRLEGEFVALGSGLGAADPTGP